MARLTVNAQFALNMSVFDFSSLQYGVVELATATLFRVRYETGFADEFTGSFVYSDGVLAGGTVTGCVLRSEAEALVTVTDVSIPVVDIVAADSTLSTSDDMGVVARALAGADVIAGNALDDWLFGFAGDDAISGRAGHDFLIGAGGNDELLGAGGDDWLFGSAGEDHLSGGTGGDELRGDPGADTLSGQGGNDELYGGVGDDELSGGIGSDDLSGGPGGDTLSGEGGHDRLLGGAGDDGLSGGIGSDHLSGGPGADTLSGQGAHDELIGGGGDDVLSGDAGADTLTGGPGKDRLSGGTGADVFDFDAVTESIGNRRDTVTDFIRGVDRIDLGTIDADDGIAGNQAFQFVGADAFSGAGAQLRFADGLLSGDSDGDMAAEFSIAVIGLAEMSESDFIL